MEFPAAMVVVSLKTAVEAPVAVEGLDLFLLTIIPNLRVFVVERIFALKVMIEVPVEEIIPWSIFLNERDFWPRCYHMTKPTSTKWERYGKNWSNSASNFIIVEIAVLNRNRLNREG